MLGEKVVSVLASGHSMFTNAKIDRMPEWRLSVTSRTSTGDHALTSNSDMCYNSEVPNSRRLSSGFMTRGYVCIY